MSEPDGTRRLLNLLYPESERTARKYLGGSDAPMLHDAADYIERLLLERAQLQAKNAVHMQTLASIALSVKKVRAECGVEFAKRRRDLADRAAQNVRLSDLVRVQLNTRDSHD